MSCAKKYTVLKVNAEGFYDLQLQNVRPCLDVQWIKVRNKSLYNVDACTVVVDYNSGGDAVVTIPDGQYTVSELITELETQLDVIDTGFDVTYNNTTERITISNSNNDFDMDSYSPCFSRITGFTTDRSGAASYVADVGVNLSNGAIGVHGLGTPHIKSNIASFNGCSIVIPDVGSANSEQLWDNLKYSLKIDGYQTQEYKLRLVSEYSEVDIENKVEVIICFEY
jgi:hypothetical protein